MAVEVEATGQVDEFLRVLRRRMWWIVVPFVVIGSLGVFFAVVVPKKYVSDAEILVRDVMESTNESSVDVAGGEGAVATTTLPSRVRIESVLNKLAWPEFASLPTTQKGEYIRNVRRNLSVDLPSMPRNSGRQTVLISYKNTDPERATAFVEQLLESWKSEVLRRHLQQEKKELLETKDQLSLTSRRIKGFRESETQIRIDNGIPPPRQTALGRDEQQHRAYGELDDLERTLSELEETLELEAITLEQMIAKRDPMNPYDDSVDAAGGPEQRAIEAIDKLISGLQLQIDTGGWTPEHSDHKKRVQEIKNLRIRRSKLLSSSGGPGFQVPTQALNQQRLNLTARIEDLEREQRGRGSRRETLLERQHELIQKTGTLSEAHKELERLAALKRSYELSATELQGKVARLEIQVNLLDSPQGDPFEEIEQPSRPNKPTSPNPYLIGIGSIVAGLGLGLALAILLEYSKNCFRSGRELSRVMPHPVLGTINAIRTRRERRRGLIVRTVMAGGSLAFVLGIGFVTWAWARDRDALTDSLVDAIDGFRRMLL